MPFCMLRRSRFVLTGLCVAVLAVGVGACGDDDKDSGASAVPTSRGESAGNGNDGSTQTTLIDSGSSGLPNDACALLGAADVEAALGVAVDGKNADRAGSGSSEPQIKGCTWGDVTADSGLIAVQVSAPDSETGIDYLESVVEAAGGGGTPVDIGEGGQLIPRAHVPYGGGVGFSVMFTNDGNTVVVGATKATEAQTKAAAAAVLAKLNG
jgi:hypothetical protein